jgi:hypothetical protein
MGQVTVPLLLEDGTIGVVVDGMTAFTQILERQVNPRLQVDPEIHAHLSCPSLHEHMLLIHSNPVSHALPVVHWHPDEPISHGPIVEPEPGEEQIPLVHVKLVLHAPPRVQLHLSDPISHTLGEVVGGGEDVAAVVDKEVVVDVEKEETEVEEEVEREEEVEEREVEDVLVGAG